MFPVRERKARCDRIYVGEGRRIQFRWVPIEMIEWLNDLAKPFGNANKNASYVAWLICHAARHDYGKGRRFGLSEQWAKYRYNGHRRVSIYVDVPLGEWLEEVCAEQHRSMNYAVVSILKEAHNRFINEGISPDLTYSNNVEDEK